jgi:AraC-like DNA-binding protein
MQSPFFSPLIHFSGIALGALLGLLLLAGRRGNRPANRWLAAHVWCLALLSVGDLLEDSRRVLDWPHLAHVTDWLIFLVGPCLWMYVRRLTMHDTPRFPRLLLHAVPALLTLLLLVPFYLLPPDAKAQLVAAELSDPAPEIGPVIMVAATQMLAYWVAALRVLFRFKRELRAQFSSTERRTFAWLRTMLFVTFGMWVLWLIGISVEGPWAPWLDVIAVPAGLYLLAFLGIRQPAVFAGRLAFVPLPPPAPIPAAGKTEPRYARSGLDRERVPDLRARLEELMDVEKPWLESDLTLGELAARAGMSPHHLSQLLNDELGASFFDYVNERRVDEVRRCLADPAYAGQTIMDIALASGFNSKASFNAVFKELTGTTPSAFRRSAGSSGPAPSPIR